MMSLICVDKSCMYKFTMPYLNTISSKPLLISKNHVTPIFNHKAVNMVYV